MRLGKREKTEAVKFLHDITRCQLFENRTWPASRRKRTNILFELERRGLIIDMGRRYCPTILGAEVDVNIWLAFSGINGLDTAMREISEFLFDVETEALNTPHYDDECDRVRNWAKVAFPRFLAQAAILLTLLGVGTEIGVSSN